MHRYYYRGRGMPLLKNNIDTDQIMPARFCYKPTRRGHDHSVFGDWQENPEFILNNPYYQRATILVAGREFATGSSREFAVWGLIDWGFKVVIAPSFGDIFYKNAVNNDLLPIILTEKDIDYIWSVLLSNHYAEIIVDLKKEKVIFNDKHFSITIDKSIKRRYIENIDDVQTTLALLNEIRQFEEEKNK